MTVRKLISKFQDLQYERNCLLESLMEEKLRSQKWMLKFEHQQELLRIYKELLERNKSLEE